MASPLQIIRSSGPVVPHSYIVKLKQGTNKETHLGHVSTRLASLNGTSELTHPHWSPNCFHGYAGKFSDASLEALLRHPEVEYVEEDAIDEVNDVTTQTNAPWGLARISQDDQLTGSTSSLTFSYTYNNAAGEGVDIYVLDTGIYTAHNDFEGRASWGKTFVGTDGEDKHGHGTHCAGTAAGKQFGVAKLANLIAVKILGDDGKGSKTNSIDGMNWVLDQVANTGRPSVVSNSTGGSFSQSQNDTVDSLTAAGIHFVVSAGNDNADASTKSPASAPTAVTVGSTTIQDSRRPSSNYGPCLGIFAPGSNVISCGITGPDSTATKSGTSMACPHVSGLIAYLISEGNDLTPEDMKQKVQDMSLKDVLSDIPSDTVNYLLRNDA